MAYHKMMTAKKKPMAKKKKGVKPASKDRMAKLRAMRKK